MSRITASSAHHFEDTWFAALADRDEQLALEANEQERRAQAEQRRRHKLVMAHMRQVTQDLGFTPRKSVLGRISHALRSLGR